MPLPQPSEGAIEHPGVGSDSQTSVYRIYDREGALLYVGMGRNPAGRWASHSEQHEWWQRAARFRVEWFETRKGAAAAEREAIRSEDPECNIYGRPGWGEYVYSKYMQKLGMDWQPSAGKEGERDVEATRQGP